MAPPPVSPMTASPAAVMVTPNHCHRPRRKPKKRSARTARKTRPPESTAWTMDSGARRARRRAAPTRGWPPASRRRTTSSERARRRCEADGGCRSEPRRPRRGTSTGRPRWWPTRTRARAAVPGSSERTAIPASVAGTGTVVLAGRSSQVAPPLDGSAPNGSARGPECAACDSASRSSLRRARLARPCRRGRPPPRSRSGRARCRAGRRRRSWSGPRAGRRPARP